jgi:hypothetical protein
MVFPFTFTFAGSLKAMRVCASASLIVCIIIHKHGPQVTAAGIPHPEGDVQVFTPPKGGEIHWTPKATLWRTRTKFPSPTPLRVGHQPNCERLAGGLHLTHSRVRLAWEKFFQLHIRSGSVMGLRKLLFHNLIYFCSEFLNILSCSVSALRNL